VHHKLLGCKSYTLTMLLSSVTLSNTTSSCIPNVSNAELLYRHWMLHDVAAAVTVTPDKPHPGQTFDTAPSGTSLMNTPRQSRATCRVDVVVQDRDVSDMQDQTSIKVTPSMIVIPSMTLMPSISFQTQNIYLISETSFLL